MNAVHASEREARQVPAVERAILVLQTLARDDRGLRLSELSETLGYPKSTLSGLLATLERFGLVERDPESNLFQLGLGLVELGGAVLRRLDLRELARPALRRLAEASGETSILHVLNDDDPVIADCAEPRGRLKVAAPIGHRLPPFAGSVAKAFLAALPEEEAAAIVRTHTLPAFTPRSLTVVDDYLEALAFAREVGYAQESDEYLDGVSAVSAAIVGAHGRPVAVLTVAAVGTRVDDDRLRTLGALVARTARDVSLRLHGPMGVVT